MKLRSAIAIITVFCAWSGFDYVIQSFLQSSSYKAAAQSWQPIGNLLIGHLWAGTLVAAVCFVMIYTLLIPVKSTVSGIVYGIIFGTVMGLIMGAASFVVHPISPMVAGVWFLGFLCQSSIAGILTAVIVKPPPTRKTRKISPDDTCKIEIK